VIGSQGPDSRILAGIANAGRRALKRPLSALTRMVAYWVAPWMPGESGPVIESLSETAMAVHTG